MKRTYFYVTKDQYPEHRPGKGTFLTEAIAVKEIKKFIKLVDDKLEEIYYEKAGPDGTEYVTIWMAE